MFPVNIFIDDLGRDKRHIPALIQALAYFESHGHVTSLVKWSL